MSRPTKKEKAVREKNLESIVAYNNSSTELTSTTSVDVDEYFSNDDSRKKSVGIHSPLIKQLSKLEVPTISDTELIAKVQKGDPTGNFLILCKHYKYILAKVIEATNGTWFSDDIFQAGIVGLYEAVQRFDPKRHNKFLTYAHYWILKYIYIEIRNELLPLGGISVGRDTKERLYNYIKYKMQGYSDERIMDALHIKEHALNELKILNATAARIRSLDKSVDTSDGKDFELSVIAKENSGSSPENEAITNAFIQYLEKVITETADLSTKMSTFLSFEFGLCGFPMIEKREACSKMSISYKEFDELKVLGQEYLKVLLEKDGWGEECSNNCENLNLRIAELQGKIREIK